MIDRLRAILSHGLVLLLPLVFLPSFTMQALQNGDRVDEIRVEGSQVVESEAVISIIDTKAGQSFDKDRLAEDIRKLFDLSYFADIKAKSLKVEGRNILKFEIKEKPAILEIKFEGFDKVKAEDLTEKITSKPYTIVNEEKLREDLLTIQQSYREKGFYLADVRYRYDDRGDNRIDLVFYVEEGEIVHVSQLHLYGNKAFSDQHLIQQMLSNPITRMSTFAGPGGLFKDEFLKRDKDFLTFYYLDNGYAEVVVTDPIVRMDRDRSLVEINIGVSEGPQYFLGDIKFEGDVLFTPEELMADMKLKPGEPFRYSLFQADVEMLTEKYGDLGYAFVDLSPQRDLAKPTEEGGKHLAHLTFTITKGKKVYFGNFTISGNSKTRDNVIRRELTVAEGELYSGTRLAESRRNVERLGFFEEVRFVRKIDEEVDTILNYDIIIKEKPTGQVNLALGYQPGVARAENRFSGQGSVAEQNQFGRGWKFSLSGKWNGGKSYSMDFDFSNPRLHDGPWSVGVGTFLRNDVTDISEDISISQKSSGGKFTLGRAIIEKIRGSVTYRLSNTVTSTDNYVIPKLRDEGLKSSVSLGISRVDTDNYIDPTEGSILRLTQTFTGGPFGGDFSFTESAAEGEYFYPIDVSDTFRTYVRLRLLASVIYPFGEPEIPIMDRYRMGGYNDLRGYEFNEIGPKKYMIRSPFGQGNRINLGGNKKLLMQAEYYIPLIPEAGIKALLFADAGRVYSEEEFFGLSDLYFNYGFGFRWTTPMGPFRFEWAYPVEDGKAGKLRFNFYIGF